MDFESATGLHRGGLQYMQKGVCMDYIYICIYLIVGSQAFETREWLLLQMHSLLSFAGKYTGSCLAGRFGLLLLPHNS